VVVAAGDTLVETDFTLLPAVTEAMGVPLQLVAKNSTVPRISMLLVK